MNGLVDQVIVIQQLPNGQRILPQTIHLKSAENKNGTPYCVLPSNQPTGNPFTCALNTASTSYSAEALYQHIAAYELQFGLPVSKGV